MLVKAGIPHSKEMLLVRLPFQRALCSCRFFIQARSRQASDTSSLRFSLSTYRPPGGIGKPEAQHGQVHERAQQHSNRDYRISRHAFTLKFCRGLRSPACSNRTTHYSTDVLVRAEVPVWRDPQRWVPAWQTQIGRSSVRPSVVLGARCTTHPPSRTSTNQQHHPHTDQSPPGVARKTCRLAS